jgi:hypothetical protein
MVVNGTNADFYTNLCDDDNRCRGEDSSTEVYTCVDLPKAMNFHNLSKINWMFDRAKELWSSLPDLANSGRYAHAGSDSNRTAVNLLVRHRLDHRPDQR